ncbi:hypothetical protein ACFWAP_09000 [Streptomyces goshikiensis]|uniref:hypothetical protein n=1 Tax=Streptomyces goshikiensis TaxID=1942 RepID=UPI003652DC6F
MADRLHQIDLCPDCDGLRAVRLDRVDGIGSITLDDGIQPYHYKGPVTVYLGPAPGPCPNSEEVARHG